MPHDMNRACFFADGLGFCANSLELGCDCVGNIFYFDAVMNDSRGETFAACLLFKSNWHLGKAEQACNCHDVGNSTASKKHGAF